MSGQPEKTKCGNTGTTSCRLLALPPELRNFIWELAFTPSGGQTEDNPVYLLNAEKPSTALLLTCCEIYKEAKGLYHHARDSYWATTYFQLDRQWYKSESTRIAALNEADLSKIKHLKIAQLGHDYILNNGIWECSYQPAIRNISNCPQRAIFSSRDPKATEAIARDLGIRFGRTGLRYSLTSSGSIICWLTKLPTSMSEEDLRLQKESVGWHGLTKEEIVRMSNWH